MNHAFHWRMSKPCVPYGMERYRYRYRYRLLGRCLLLTSFEFLFLDVEITCPNHIDVYINRSVAESKNVSWDKPLVRNKKNDTKFSMEVFPQWAEPPVILPEERPIYVIKYVVRNEFGQTASCSFNITVYNDSCKFHRKHQGPVYNDCKLKYKC